MPVEASEDIARAICSDKFDPATGEISPSLFKGANTSVSRLAIVPLPETWPLFRKRVEKPPERTLERIGTLNCGTLSEVGVSYEASPKQLTVEPDPLPNYASHAVIPEKISRGLANKIVQRLELHTEEGHSRP